MPNKKSGLLAKLAQRSDVALAFLLVTIIFMMILPLPTLLIDVLIGMNMSLAIILLMVAVYLNSPLAFAAFPSVLLLSTIFRLALSISTTRLILTEAEAGKIIQTFGEFVVGGNLIVGLVVFLIITIVQFVVITKGSERIAEVSARFSLDAMPGKQMSIDSDLRAGVISMHDARSRRERLEKESQLYGSMDGAMKFVKGDAIAGLIIIIVNIIGGISIGALQNGMEIGGALELYSILTIGDGLVSQIPALFISITAGIIVSRVTVDEDSNLGQDISGQLTAQPNALLIGSAVIAMMGLIPGFPMFVFFFLAFVIGLTGFLLRKKATQQNFAEDDTVTVIGQTDGALPAGAAGAAALTSNASKEEDVEPLAPVLVELPENARQSLVMEELNQEFTDARRTFYKDLGVPLSGISLRLSDMITDDNYQISVRGIPVAEGQLGINTPVLTSSNDALNNDSTLPVNTKDATSSQQQLVPVEILKRHTNFILRRHAAEFIGIQETHALLGKLESAGYATLVQEAQRTTPNIKIVDVFRRLLNEGISIRDLRQILETLVEHGESEKDIGMLTERVRISMRRQISYTFTNGTGKLPVYMLDPDSEKLLNGSVRQTPAGVSLAIQPDVAKRLSDTLNALEEKTRQDTALMARPVILTSLELRRHLRTHLSTEFPGIPILSLPELIPTVSVQPVGELRLTQAG